MVTQAPRSTFALMPTLAAVTYRVLDALTLLALSSLAPLQLAFFHRAIDAVSDSCSNARTVQATRVCLTGCPSTSYGNGRFAF